jgi:hypothetical protein
MRPYRAPLGPSVTFFAVLSWAGCITNMSGFDLRQAQDALNVRGVIQAERMLNAII